MLKSIAALSLALASFAGFAQAAASDDKPCAERPDVNVAFSQVKNGGTPEPKGACRQRHEDRRKAGVMTDYPIHEATPRDPRDAIEILTVSFPGNA